MSFMDMPDFDEQHSDGDNGDGLPIIQVRSLVDVKQLNKGDDSIDTVSGIHIATDGLSETQIDALVGIGWKPDLVTVQDGSTYDCLHHPAPAFIYVTQRNAWVEGEGSKLEVIVLHDEARELGPFKFSLQKTAAMAFAAFSREGGMYTHRAISDHSTKEIKYEAILPQMRVLTKAAHTAMKKANKDAVSPPKYAFKMTLGYRQDGKQQHVIQIGSDKSKQPCSLLQLINVPHKADEVTKELLDSLYIGNDGMALVADLLTEYSDWATGWTPTAKQSDDEETVAEASVAEAEAALEEYDLG